jgi:hypothetical protein
MDNNNFCYPLQGIALSETHPCVEGKEIASEVCTCCGGQNKARSIECALTAEMWMFRQISRWEFCADCFAQITGSFRATDGKPVKRGFYDWPLSVSSWDYQAPRSNWLIAYD